MKLWSCYILWSSSSASKVEWNLLSSPTPSLDLSGNQLSPDQRSWDRRKTPLSWMFYTCSPCSTCFPPKKRHLCWMAQLLVCKVSRGKITPAGRDQLLPIIGPDASSRALERNTALNHKIIGGVGLQSQRSPIGLKHLKAWSSPHGSQSKAEIVSAPILTVAAFRFPGRKKANRPCWQVDIVDRRLLTMKPAWSCGGATTKTTRPW